jgi:hypothetical protein
VSTLVVGALALVVIGAFGAAVWSKRRAPRVALAIAGDLPRRAAAAARALATAEPWLPATAPDAPEAAAAIEAALIAGDASKALAAAEAAVAAAPDAAAPRVWLAWALCASAEPAAALVQLETARGLASGVLPGGALGAYVEARAGHLAFERATGAAALGAVPPLVTAGDLAIVTLAGAKGGAAWLAGAADAQVSPAEVSAAMAEHRTATARALGRALDALDAAPGFADAGYLAARLAVKAGALAEARALFAALASRMAGRPDGDSFARDVADLDDPSGAVAAALAPPKAPIAATAKRSRSLKVL